MKIPVRDIAHAFNKAKADAWLRQDMNVEEYSLWAERLDNVAVFQKFVDKQVRNIDCLDGWRLMEKKVVPRKLHG